MLGQLRTAILAVVRCDPQGAQQAILRANGADSRPLFRFPYGDVNSRVLGDVNRLGYASVRSSRTGAWLRLKQNTGPRMREYTKDRLFDLVAES